MVAEQTIPDIDRKGLREFALVTGGIVAALFGLLLPWLFDLQYRSWPWIVGGVLAAWGIIAPGSLRLLYRGWMRFGMVLSRVTTPIILGLVFLIAVVPTAIMLRLSGKDPMGRRLDQDVESYRVKSAQPPVKNLERPF
jgi:Saxitoxin biosynthesis operon protein SxtJ